MEVTQAELDQVDAETTAQIAAAEAEETGVQTDATKTEDASTTQEQAPQTAAELARTFRAKVKGEEIEVPVYDESGKVRREVIDGYQMREHFTREMQKFQEEKKQFALLRAQEQEKYERRMQEIQEKIIDRINPKEQEADPFKELPSDDPYVKMLRKQAEAQNALMTKLAQAERSIQQQAQFIQRDFQERQAKQQQAAVAEAERTIKTNHPDFDDNDLRRVELEYLAQADAARRNGQGPPDIHDVAVQYAQWINAKAEAALNKFKETAKIETTPAGKVGGSKTPVPKEKYLDIDKGEVLDSVLEDIKKGIL